MKNNQNMKKMLSTVLAAFLVCGAAAQTKIETVRIPAGTFEMGNTPKGHESYRIDPKHDVTISEDFYMCKYEVTNAQYAEFLNAAGVGGDGMCETADYGGQKVVEASKGELDWGMHYEGGRWVPADGCADFPAIYVTWYGAAEFARRAGGSLPTEAQWEYASRGGREGKLFGIGDGDKLYCDMANIMGKYPFDREHGGEIKDYDGSLGHPHESPMQPVKVGSYPDYTTDTYGLHDMHGNVSEWCADWFQMQYGLNAEQLAGVAVDPEGNGAGEERVFRGGNCRSPAVFSRSAARDADKPGAAYANIGFRVVFKNQPE